MRGIYFPDFSQFGAVFLNNRGKIMEIKIYENQICPFDISLLDEDKYTFFVLKRIIKGECRLTFTDNEKLIICHSAYPYPIWVWLSKETGEQELERCYLLLKEHFFLKGFYRINTTYQIAEYLIERCKKDGINVKIDINMLSYTCPTPIPPKKKADGFAKTATYEDLEVVLSLIKKMNYDVGEIPSEEVVREKALQLIENQAVFLWIDKYPVAICAYRKLEETACINHVYTEKEVRRKGYCSNLVYYLSEKLKNMGLLPSLYTDGDYKASNQCYQQIGYILEGDLCTIDKEE